jgi:hypothetical protein
LRNFAALIVIIGLVAVPAGLAQNGTITKGYGGEGGNVQAVIEEQSAPDATAAVATGSALPFTGADLALVSFAGITLLGMGFGLRRIARNDRA